MQKLKISKIDYKKRGKMEGIYNKSAEELLNLINSLIVFLDSNGTIVLINKKGCELLGYKKQELIGKNWFDACIPKEKRKEVHVVFNRLMKGELNYTEFFENLVLTKKGREKIISWHSTLLKDDKGKITGTISSGEDITERKKAEKELKESEEKYKVIFDEAAEGIIVADAEKKNFISANKKIQEMLKYSEKEILELGITGIHPKKDLPLVIEKFKEQREGKITTAENLPVLRKDGKVIYCDITSSQVMIRGKKIMLGFFRDITERKKAEKELKESEEKYRLLVENIPQKIFLKDSNLVYISCNENYAKDLKIKPKEITGKTDFDFFPKELAEKYRADDKRLMETDKMEDIEEGYIQDEKKVFVHTIKTPVKDEKGNVIGILGIFWDITERKKAEEELKERAEELEKFNQFAVGRELKMVELKKEINELLNQRGQPKRYQID
ncbi:hypothetical protein A3K73_05645 [Candidatus Pacearchaeota archaeon RBG_13_36_9]|nr:MAG: hypothetical protein A3K73_05645 [Candidatus Pacearchaeota archaeon RBG_13_36_9]